ncbi:MAG: SiaB family protein kinase [Bacteroidota bacterium]|nr:SiaB family protein kinase [Bacteroidota bacterium]
MNIDVKELFRDFYKGDILYEYEGDITNNSIDIVLSTIEEKLNTLNVKPGLRKKAFRVIVESIQNLYHNIPEKPPESSKTSDKFGVFVISLHDNCINIASGNFIKRDKIQILKARFDQVNSLTAEEIKYIYREILNSGEFTDKGGAGLGLLDIARKTGNELTYYFHDYNDEFGFLTIVIKVTVNE